MTAHLLIVDDNPINLKLAADLLEIDGHKVERAVDAEHAAELLKHFIPDLILMDIALPGIDGLTFTRMLKTDERLKHVPVIAITAFAMKGDEKKAFDAGCSGYITKPIDTRKFSLQVAAFLPAGSRKQDRSRA